MKVRIILVVLAFALNVSITKAQDIATVHRVLTALYKSTNGGQWNNNSGWDTTAVPALMNDFHSWHGININSDNVESIKLSDNNLNGPIPPEIGLLAKLDSLVLYNNNLTGQIPAEIGNLKELDMLSLYNNKLTGEIPKELGNLRQLAYLILSSNELIGSIPTEIGKLENLISVLLGSNKLTGFIPSEIGNLRYLLYLNLSNNQFSGEVPRSFRNFNNVRSMYLQNNQLTGELPRGFIRLFALQTFQFDNNQGLCAPLDDDFQRWLASVRNVTGPNCVAVSTEELPEFDVIQFYPNPVSDHVTFTGLPYDAIVNVFDILGREVLSSDEAYIDMSDLLPGIYMYTVISEEGRITGKLIKQ